ncbi:MAG TPA: sorbosone dehydrogenase family protein [Chthonomonadaceae bacterium]|nr:sorbosone dehydrogenase family protein [Chthonomonadaceae bacterium]
MQTRTPILLLFALFCGAAALASCTRGDRAAPLPQASTPGAGGAGGSPAADKPLTPQDLPAPYATPSANNEPRVVARPAGASLKVPAGFQVAEFAAGLDNPRWLAIAPNGDVFCVESGPGRVTVLRDADGDGKAEFRQTFATGLTLPFGIAFWKNYLYVANTNSVVRFPYQVGQTEARGGPEVVVPDIPGRGYRQHWTRDLIFNPAGTKMYLSVGSEHNVAEEEPRRAAILEFNPDGSGERIFASGIRNAVGKAFNPVTGQLWTTCNERDGLGDDLVPDYVTSVKEGGFYGWPYYYIGPHHDPRMPAKPELKARVIVPDVLLQSHVAALGMVFYTGKQFPEEYRNDAFVALHGSWNRRERVGYSVIRIRFQNGKPVGGYEDFLTGWMLGPRDPRVWGRPVGLAVAKDGSLLVVDDGAGKIWRVSYRG